MVAIINRLKFYGQNTNLHGLRYVADSNQHPFVRILWILIFLTSTVGMLRIFKGSYESFTYNAISFVTETTYLDWNTTFPAVSVCEVSSSEVFWTASPSQAFSPMHQFLSEILFFTGSCYSCSSACKECEGLNYRELVKRYRKECARLLKSCRWNGVTFNCCDKFLPLETEYGVCFTINSLHTRSTKDSYLDMMSNRKTGPGKLTVQPTQDVKLYIHAPEDVPFINSETDLREEVMMGESYNIIINIIEIENDENVENVDVEKRGCRFPWEKPQELRVHDLYSYSSCVVQCHADAHVRLCNCTHHLMPKLGKDSFCNMSGLLCLTDNFETLNRLHAKGFDKLGLVCECVPSCVEPEYKIVAKSKGGSNNLSEVEIRLQSLPTTRFKRNVVRTTMDLVVSIGGTAGLFLGASLLSIVETIYLLLLRHPQ